ncbi:hypothetical protein R6Q57_011201 [Mikania cordata]
MGSATKTLNMSYQKALGTNPSYKSAVECLTIELTDIGTSLKLLVHIRIFSLLNQLNQKMRSYNLSYKGSTTETIRPYNYPIRFIYGMLGQDGNWKWHVSIDQGILAAKVAKKC